MAYYLSAFIDPGNSGGSVIIPDFMEGYESKPIVYYCGQCSAQFDDRNTLILHEWEAHPTKQPLMFLDNEELTSTRFFCRDKNYLGKLICSNYDSMIVNGERVILEEFNSVLKQSGDMFYNILLTNKKVSKTFELDVKIAEASELKAIDECFMDYFSKRSFTSETLDNFIQSTKKYTSASHYVDGIVSYIHGILAKDNRTQYIDYEQFEAKLNQSLNTLSSFNTALAQVVCNLIYFIKNDLHSIVYTGVMPEFEHATRFLLLDKKLSPCESKVTGNIQLPIDSVTDQTIRLITKKYHAYEHAEPLQKEIDALQRSGSLTSSEKDKLNMLLYRKALECHNETLSQKLSKKLKYSDVFCDYLEHS
jgi:hypothetical protein